MDPQEEAGTNYPINFVAPNQIAVMGKRLGFTFGVWTDEWRKLIRAGDLEGGMTVWIQEKESNRWFHANRIVERPVDRKIDELEDELRDLLQGGALKSRESLVYALRAFCASHKLQARPWYRLEGQERTDYHPLDLFQPSPSIIVAVGGATVGICFNSYYHQDELFGPEIWTKEGSRWKVCSDLIEEVNA